MSHLGLVEKQVTLATLHESTVDRTEKGARMRAPCLARDLADPSGEIAPWVEEARADMR